MSRTSLLSSKQHAAGSRPHVVVIFVNVGGYHAVRLRAAHAACLTADWNFTAIQHTDDALQHPWGDLSNQITFPLVTLSPGEVVRPAVGRQSSHSPIARKVQEYLDALRPDVVFCPGWGFPIAVGALAWCRRNGVPSVLMSESKQDDERRTWWRETVKRFLYVRHFSAGLVGGEAHAHYLRALGMPSRAIYSGYDVVDNDYFAAAATRARRDPESVYHQNPAMPKRPFILACSRFLPRKNVLTLVEAYAMYVEAVGDDAWDLVLCGSGQGREQLERAIVSAGLEKRVHLPGFITYGSIGEWYGLAEVFVHPAISEQWGLVINEAAAAGLPVLCSMTVGAAPHLVQDGVNGYAFPPHRAGDLARLLVTMHSLPAHKRREMGRVSQELVRAFAPEVFGHGVVASALYALGRK